MGYKKIADIKCPFFINETEMSITCEGPEAGSRCKLRFEDLNSKYRYIDKHCVNYPNDCSICHGAKIKYEEDK